MILVPGYRDSGTFHYLTFRFLLTLPKRVGRRDFSVRLCKSPYGGAHENSRAPSGVEGKKRKVRA